MSALRTNLLFDRRAARFGVGFAPVKATLFDLYDAECRRLGHAPGRKFGPSPPSNIHLTEDPERAWTQLMPHLRHVVAKYAKWADAEANSNSPFQGLLHDEQALRSSGMFAVWTPDELHAAARRPGA